MESKEKESEKNSLYVLETKNLDEFRDNYQS